MNKKNVLKSFLSLFVSGQTILFSLCLGTSKILSWGEFDESKNSLDFNPFFLVYYEINVDLFT